MCESFYNLGIAYYQRGHYGVAVEAFEKFLEAKPDYENAHNSLGLSYKGLRKWDKAIASFQEEMKYRPGNFYAQTYLGDVYLELKNYPKALVHYKHALNHADQFDVRKIREAVSSIEIAQKQKDKKRKVWRPQG